MTTRWRRDPLAMTRWRLDLLAQTHSRYQNRSMSLGPALGYLQHLESANASLQRERDQQKHPRIGLQWVPTVPPRGSRALGTETSTELRSFSNSNIHNDPWFVRNHFGSSFS